MSNDNTIYALEERVLEQKWFYRYQLPSGRETELYIPDEVEHIHRTRRDMMLAELQPLFENNLDDLTAIDVASHQGYFSIELARHCKDVLGLEYQERHVKSARLIAETLGVTNARFIEDNIETMPSRKYEPADIVINFGLMYNLENPIGALRRCREMTKRVLLIETQ
jgi:2-polyprenyl-3-methyl-5-hydroxy-6-metoxy-1,4-benzoquinol methylase